MSDQAEGELIYYLRVIWKWKGVLLGGALLIAAVAFVLHLLTPKTYEVSRILQIGTVMGKPLESWGTTIHRVRDERLLRQVIESLNLHMTPAGLAKQIAVDPRTNPHIRYMVRASSPEMAFKIAEAISDRIVEAHQQILNDGFTVAQGYIAGLEQQIQDVEAEISRLRGALAGFALNPGAGSTAPHLLDNYIPAFERLFALKKSIRDWLLTLSSLQSKSTLVIASDVEPTTPVSPRISNVAQVIGLGLFLLILLVFFLERLEERRGRAH